MPSTDRFPQLRLPKRFEVLEREAAERDSDVKRIIQRVDAATARVETLLRQVRDGGVGRFELFLGKSGSGKTTFFRTLAQFFEGVDVREVPASVELADVARHIESRTQEGFGRVVWVMYDRDNLRPSPDDARAFFESLRVLFRAKKGQVVIAWPITDVSSAQSLSRTAWEIGRDSVVDLNRGLFDFVGLPKSDFALVADITTRSLNGGQSLETFGLTADVIEPVLSESETISEFYSRLEAKSKDINGYYLDILKERVIPSVWILVGGDDSRELSLTINTLTQGTDKLVDIDRIISYLDNPDQDAAYLKDWKDRRDQMAFIMRALDVRVFELAPNVVLAAIRAFGSSEISSALNLASVGESAAVYTIKNSGFYRTLVGADKGKASTLVATNETTSDEYRRVQVLARRQDKEFNKALSSAIQAALREDGVDAEVRTEKQAPSSNMKPDIMITLGDGQVICIEPTYRSTGTEIPGEQKKRQNTLTVGHIQKYMLEKIIDYVKDLDM